MKRKNLYMFIFVALFAISSVSSCSNSPSGESIQTDIVQTQISQLTDTPVPTNTPIPTNTPPPTITNTPTPTLTPSFTPSPTPDLRVFDIDPRKLLLNSNDLPPDAQYYLPSSDWISPHRNSEIVSAWGAEKGKEYLDRTGRVDGWWVSYKRGSSTVIAPEEIYDNVVLYKTSEGARLVITEYSACQDPETGYSIVDVDTVIGDITTVCIDTEMQSNGKNRVWVRVEFVYRNAFHGIVGWGWESDVSLDYVMNVALIAYSKLESQRLSDAVTFQP